MKIRQTLLAIGIIVASCSTGLAGFVFPTGLNPGDQFRVAFLTRSTRNATSTNIADYNAFVSAEANLEADLVALGTQWNAIASTASVSARDNTSTVPSSPDVDVPIYLVNGTKLANGNADFWDGTHLASLNITSRGSNVPFDSNVWTGSRADGTIFTDHALGDGGSIVTGSSLSTDSTWAVKQLLGNANATLRFYALSAPISVSSVPEPSSLMLLSVGSLTLVCRGRFKRIRHEKAKPTAKADC